MHMPGHLNQVSKRSKANYKLDRNGKKQSCGNQDAANNRLTTLYKFARLSVFTMKENKQKTGAASEAGSHRAEPQNIITKGSTYRVRIARVPLNG